VTNVSRAWIVCQLDVDGRTPIGVGFEVYAPGVLNDRAGLRPPFQPLIRSVGSDHGLPFRWQASRPGHDPVRAPVAEVLHLTHIRHKAREVLVVIPEPKDAFDRRVDRDRLLTMDGPFSIAQTKHAPQFHIGERPC
jgi:hypothetical protein